MDYREGARAYKICDFKASENQAVITYTPEQIAAYGFKGGRFYESHKIKTIDKLEETVFLEVIVRGLVSLYRKENTYWISKETSELIPLINDVKEVYIKDVRTMVNTNQHIGTLNILMSDCPALRDRIQKIKLNERPLSNLVHKYNACKNTDVIVFKDKRPWVRFGFGVAGGLNISQIDFNTTGKGFQYLLRSFDSYKGPMGGISVDIHSPRLSQRFSFHSNAFLLSTNYYSYSTETIIAFHRNYASLELRQLKVPFGIRYTFPARQITPYVNIGASATFLLRKRFNWTNETEYKNEVYTTSGNEIDMRDQQLGLWGGIGALKSISPKLNVFLEARFERTDGVIPYSTQPDALRSSITNIQVLFGIRMK